MNMLRQIFWRFRSFVVIAIVASLSLACQTTTSTGPNVPGPISDQQVTQLASQQGCQGACDICLSDDPIPRWKRSTACSVCNYCVGRGGLDPGGGWKGGSCRAGCQTMLNSCMDACANGPISQVFVCSMGCSSADYQCLIGCLE